MTAVSPGRQKAPPASFFPRALTHALGIFAALVVLVVAAPPAGSQGLPQPPPLGPAPSGAAGPTRSNLLNPDLSVVGWIQYATDDDLLEPEGGAADTPVAEVREAEIGFQAAVDPYSRADLFVAVSPGEGTALEEGYLTFLALPGAFQARLGRHRSVIGRFNRTHPGETAFADRPLVAERFLGEEGLAIVGGAVSRLVPNPWDLYVNVDVEVSAAPEGVPVFAPAGREDLLYGGRLSAFADLSESVNLSIGGSLYRGPHGSPAGGGPARHALLAGGDLTVRWKDPRRAIYRSFLWTTEVLAARVDGDPADGEGAPGATPTGAFSHAEYQFARRWRAGARYDWTDSLEEGGPREWGGLGYLTFTPSEFTLLSLQASRHKRGDDWGGRIFLKVTFAMGPHGVHPF